MKLHLPTSLRSALIACMGVACFTVPAAYAAEALTITATTETLSNIEETYTAITIQGANSTLNVTGGSKISANSLIATNSSAGHSFINIGSADAAENAAKSLLWITSTDSDLSKVSYYKAGLLRLSHYSNKKTTLNIYADGELRAEGAVVSTADDGTSVTSILGGEMNVRGLWMKNTGASVINMSSGKLNLGAYGIKGAGTITLTGGNLGSLDAAGWTSVVDISMGNTTIQTNVYTMSETTQDWAGYTGTGVDIILSGKLTTTAANTLVGSGSLTISNTLDHALNYGTYAEGEQKATLKLSSLDNFDYYLANGTTHGRSSDYLIMKGASNIDSVMVGTTSYDLVNSGDVMLVAAGNTVYTVHSGTAVYDATTSVSPSDFSGVSKIVLKGGVLDMQTGLADIEGGIHIEGTSASAPPVVSLADAVTLTRSELTVSSGNTVKLAGSGTYDLGMSATTPTGVSVLTADLADGSANKWTGTVRIGGGTSALHLQGATFSGLYTDTSTIELNGVRGYLGYNHSANFKLTDNGSIAALNIHNGSSSTPYVFSGKFSGDGSFVRGTEQWREGVAHFKFTGDISEWTGSFTVLDSTGASLTGSATTTLTFSDAARAINIAIGNQSATPLTVNVENAQEVSVTGDITGTATTVHYKSGGNKNVSSDASTYAGGTVVEGGSVTLMHDSGLGTGTVKLYEGSLILSSTRSLSNTIELGGSAAAGDNPVATITEKTTGTPVSYTGATLSHTGITLASTTQGEEVTPGSISGAIIDMDADMSITTAGDASITNSTLDMAAGTTLTKAGAGTLTLGLDDASTLAGLAVAQGGVSVESGMYSKFSSISLAEGSQLNIELTGNTTSTAFMPTGAGDVSIDTNGHTWTIAHDHTSAENATTSTYTGDILVSGGGVLQLGKGGNHEQDVTIHGNALGAEGSITLQGKNTTLHLASTQKGTVTLGKNIILGDGTKLTTNDGHYTLKSVQLEQGAAATLHYKWGKTITINELIGEANEAGQPTGTLTIEHSENEQGAVKITDKLSLGTLTHNASNSVLTISAANATLNTLNVQAGTVNLSHTGIDITTLNITGGTVSLSSGGAYTALDDINIGNGGVLWLSHTDTSMRTANITIDGGGKLKLDNGKPYASGNAVGSEVGAADKTITINATETTPAIIAAGVYGNTTIHSSIEGQGTLELRRSETNNQNQVFLNGVISGDMGIKHTSGKYTLKQSNTYSGGTTIDGDPSYTVMTVEANDALGSGDVTLKQGKLYVSGTRTLKNTVNFGSAEAPSATLSKKGTDEDATVSYSNVTLTEGGIESTANGSISGASITVTDTSSADFALKGVTATDCTFSVNAALKLEEGSSVGAGSEVHISSTGSLLGDGSATLTGSGHTLAVEVAENNLLVAVESTDAQFYNITYTQVASAQLSGINGDADGAVITVSLSGAQVEEWTAEGSKKDIFLVFKAPTSTYALETTEGSGSSVSGLTFQVDSTLAELGYQVGTYETQYLNNTLNAGEIGIYLTTQQRTETQVIPEPATATLSLLALAALAARRRRR